MIPSYDPDFRKFLHLWTGKKFLSFYLAKNQGNSWNSGKVRIGGCRRSATIMTVRKIKGDIQESKKWVLGFG